MPRAGAAPSSAATAGGRASEAPRRAGRRTQCGALGERGQRSWRPARSRGWCLWSGGRAGGRAGRPGGSAPSPGHGLCAREKRRGGATLGPALGLQPPLPGFPARDSPVRRRRERHCNGTGTPALHCGSF